MVITIVFDNNPADPSLTTAFGFSCLVEAPGGIILFDTGSDGKVLRDNLGTLNLHPSNIDSVFLSHYHWDHTGGLGEILRLKPDPTVYLPASFPGDFIREVRKSGATVVQVDQGREIGEGLYTTGEMSGRVIEQSLICRSPSGLVVVTGCAHPGILNILGRAKVIDEHIFLALGGFHLRSESPSSLEKTVGEFRTLGVTRVCPCHCTGDQARAFFKNAYRDHCILGGVGTRIEIE